MYHPILSMPTKPHKDRLAAGMSYEEMSKFSLLSERMIRKYEEDYSRFDEDSYTGKLHKQAIKDFKKLSNINNGG